MCGLVAIHGDQLLSFACPKESNQRKDTLASAVTRASCPRDCASRLRGSPTVRPCTEVELAGLLPAIAVATVPAPARRGREGPGKSEARQSLPQKRCEVSPHIATPFIDDAAYMRRTPSPSFRRKPESILPLLLLSGPSEQRRRANGKAACTARGRREGSRRFGCRPWMACQPNPFARSEPLAARAARIRGCRFLWLLSFGQAKESNRRPWMADETHTDVSQS